MALIVDCMQTQRLNFFWFEEHGRRIVNIGHRQKIRMQWFCRFNNVMLVGVARKMPVYMSMNVFMGATDRISSVPHTVCWVKRTSLLKWFLLQSDKMVEIKCILFGNWPTIAPRNQKRNIQTYLENVQSKLDSEFAIVWGRLYFFPIQISSTMLLGRQ